MRRNLRGVQDSPVTDIEGEERPAIPGAMRTDLDRAVAQTAAAVLGHNYPDSQWYGDSFKLLQSGGLEPRESGADIVVCHGFVGSIL